MNAPKFRAAIVEPSKYRPGVWLCRTYDRPDLAYAVVTSSHPFRWLARLHAWAFMRGWTNG